MNEYVIEDRAAQSFVSRRDRCIIYVGIRMDRLSSPVCFVPFRQTACKGIVTMAFNGPSKICKFWQESFHLTFFIILHDTLRRAWNERMHVYIMST